MSTFDGSQRGVGNARDLGHLDLRHASFSARLSEHSAELLSLDDIPVELARLP